MPDIGILVVDDNSPDGTAELAAKLAAEHGDIDLLARPSKQGLGFGVPRRVPPGASTAGADVVRADRCRPVARRRRPARHCSPTSSTAPTSPSAAGTCPAARTESWPWQRRWLSRWGNRYAAGVLGLAVNDATAGYRAYRVGALEAMEFDTVTAEGYGFQIEMTHRLVRAGGRIVEFPIAFRDAPGRRVEAVQGIVGEAVGLVGRLWVADRRGRRTRRRRSG